MTWREKVLSLMQQQNISQKQLAQRSGISESSISRYLHADKRPRMDIVVNIANALHVETTYLLDDNDATDSAFNSIATAIARKGNELTPEERNQLIMLILGRGSDV